MALSMAIAFAPAWTWLPLGAALRRPCWARWAPALLYLLTFLPLLYGWLSAA